jgi:CheY-like chemotaxis protein
MKNVLLVDDDSVSNFISTKTLERMAIADDIHTALNGEQALDLFSGYYRDTNSLPDVILLDLNMPVMDGFDFLKAFKQLDLPTRDSITIIVVSSSMHPDDIRQAKELGANGYMSKPVTTQGLTEALEAYHN